MKNVAFNLRSALSVACLFCLSVLTAQKSAVSTDFISTATGRFGLQAELPIHPKWSLTGGFEVLNYTKKGSSPALFLLLYSVDDRLKINGKRGCIGLKSYPFNSHSLQTGFNIEGRLAFGNIQATLEESSSLFLFYTSHTSWPTTSFQHTAAVCQMGYRMNFGHFMFNPTVNFSMSKCSNGKTFSDSQSRLPASKLPLNLHGEAFSLGLNVGLSF